MLIIGIDPGSRFCGYGLLQYEAGKVIAAGCDVINTDIKQSLEKRLVSLYEGLDKILSEYPPDYAAIETMFFHKHIKSIFSLGHARGVVLLCLAKRAIPIVEYSPRDIKKSVVGNGNATKQQVRYMMAQMYGFDPDAMKDDAADALAIATTHYYKRRFIK